MINTAAREEILARIRSAKVPAAQPVVRGYLRKGPGGVELFAERVGTKSLTLGHRIASATQDDVVYADGSTVLVWVDAAGASVPLPPAIRRACGQP